MSHPDTSCPLCTATAKATRIETPHGFDLFVCGNCRIARKSPDIFPDLAEEKRRYLEHENNPDSEGYKTFLSRAVEPTLPHLKPGSLAIDFGCGPGPAIKTILHPFGVECLNYDPIFFPDFPAVKADVIYATECFEHFFDPQKSLSQIMSLLDPGGLLSVMTEVWETEERLPNWYYIRDTTHVSFYHKETMKYLCGRYNMELVFSDRKRVFVYRKL